MDDATEKLVERLNRKYDFYKRVKHDDGEHETMVLLRDAAAALEAADIRLGYLAADTERRTTAALRREAAQRPPVSPDYEERYYAAVAEVQKLFADAPTPGEVVRALERIGWAPIPVHPVSPEVREEMLRTAVSAINSEPGEPGWSGVNGIRVVTVAIDAILTRFSVPSQPVYDEEKIADWFATFAVQTNPYGLSIPIDQAHEAAAALVAALRSGELTKEGDA